MTVNITGVQSFTRGLGLFAANFRGFVIAVNFKRRISGFSRILGIIYGGMKINTIYIQLHSKWGGGGAIYNVDII